MSVFYHVLYDIPFACLQAVLSGDAAADFFNLLVRYDIELCIGFGWQSTRGLVGRSGFG